MFYNSISVQFTASWLILTLDDYSTETTEADHQISGNRRLDFVPVKTDVAELRDSLVEVVIKSVSRNRADVRGVQTCREYRYITHVIQFLIGQKMLNNFLY